MLWVNLFFFRFLALNALVVYFYVVSFQQVDDDEYGGLIEILKEGMMTSFSTFLVAWITVYTGLNME